jgi:transposase
MELKQKKRRFSRQFINRAVADVESGMSRIEVCEKYGMSYATIKNWMTQYGSNEFHKNSRLKITAHQKRLIIIEIQEGRLTFAEASLSHGVKVGTLRNWIWESNKESNVDLGSNESTMGTSKDSIPEELQRALHNANLKVLALETMIDVAEEQLKINIRKKPGAKQ